MKFYILVGIMFFLVPPSYANYIVFWVEGNFFIQEKKIYIGDTIQNIDDIKTDDFHGYLIYGNDSIYHEIYAKIDSINIKQHTYYTKYIFSQILNKCVDYKQLDKTPFFEDDYIPAIFPNKKVNFLYKINRVPIIVRQETLSQYDSARVRFTSFEDVVQLEYPITFTEDSIYYVEISMIDITMDLITDTRKNAYNYDGITIMLYQDYYSQDKYTKLTKEYDIIFQQKNFHKKYLNNLIKGLFFDNYNLYFNALHHYLSALQQSDNNPKIRLFYEAFLTRHGWYYDK